MAQPPQRMDGGAKKRKLQSEDTRHTQASKKGNGTPHKKQKTGQNQQNFRSKHRDARTLVAQTSNEAFKNGALDVSAFVSAREYEIRALEQGMQRSKKANNRRAFQQVPRELRRRTAAHDVRRIPKRLRDRGRKEMREDNTPGPGGVGKRVKEVSRRARLREQTVKQLRALGAKTKAAKQKRNDEKLEVRNRDATTPVAIEKDQISPETTIQTRRPKVKKSPSLAVPPVPKAKFRRRQKHKSWLPTHLFHAKRAHMTPPSTPLWRFAIPTTPTQKSYRPTHRAGSERGAVAWDMSYMATVGLEGRENSLRSVLRGLGVGVTDKAGDEWLWGAKGERWRSGKRVAGSLAFDRESGRMIAPVSIIWCGREDGAASSEASKRRIFVRVHPSAFHQLWAEMARLVKIAKPAAKIEDLRFEIGSIEVAGPDATEALIGTLWPYSTANEAEGNSNGHLHDVAATSWTMLNGLTDTSALSVGALMPLQIQDPRLHHPPRTVKLPRGSNQQDELLNHLADWPLDKSPVRASPLFHAASRAYACKLPSQKAINRRKSVASPGAYPTLLQTDPAIPVILISTNTCSLNGWTIIAPWKTIQPIWYGVMYYPLSTGGQPRFGGLREQQQLAFETGRPWFPGDAPGTDAGWVWEIDERKKRSDEWAKRPKAKRIAWEKVAANGDGKGGRGEVGDGWACAWEMLLGSSELLNEERETAEVSENAAATEASTTNEPPKDDIGKATIQVPITTSSTAPLLPRPKALIQLTRRQAESVLRLNFITSPEPPSQDIFGKLVTVKLTLLTRGVPQICARIYRLPLPTSTNGKLRKSWLELLPGKQQKKKDKSALPPRLRDGASIEEVQRSLAQELIRAGKADDEGSSHPACPPREDLMGFVTAGNYNLAEGKGTGIGSIAIWRLGEVSNMGKQGRLCVVRNAGEDVARLARWDVV